MIIVDKTDQDFCKDCDYLIMFKLAKSSYMKFTFTLKNSKSAELTL